MSICDDITVGTDPRWLIADRPGRATREWVLQGVLRTAFVAAATPLMFLAISWIGSIVAPPTLPDGNFTYSASESFTSPGEYVSFVAGLTLYLGFATWCAAVVGAVVGLVLGLVASALDAMSFRHVAPSLIAVLITLAVWAAALTVSQIIGQQNWVTEDFGQLALSAPFVLGLATLAVVPLQRSTAATDRRGEPLASVP